MTFLEVLSHHSQQTMVVLQDTNWWLVCFIIWGLSKAIRQIVSIFTFALYKPFPILDNPRFNPADATVVVPTVFSARDELTKCLGRILDSTPSAVHIVTANANVGLVKELCATCQVDMTKITVLGVVKLNKRLQMLAALEHVETDVTVFADDDVFWPKDYLKYLLAAFENPAVGAAGTRQRVVRKVNTNVWNYLGIGYLERRVWNNLCTNAIDGSISTLSGRTAAYLTKILKNERFFYYYQNDSWKGKLLTTDDDKALTRWTYAEGYQIALQSDGRSVLMTTLEEGTKFLHQCTRWARGHFRGNLTVMRKETYWCSWKYAWGCYVIYFGQYQTPALLFDGILAGLLYQAMKPHPIHATAAYLALGLWLFFTKIMKMIPHFIRHPVDMKFIPASILFSYLHGFINVYAKLTLTTTSWGSQNLAQLEQARVADTSSAPSQTKSLNGDVSPPGLATSREATLTPVWNRYPHQDQQTIS